jgi:hypothetical protein
MKKLPSNPKNLNIGGGGGGGGAYKSVLKNKINLTQLLKIKP